MIRMYSLRLMQSIEPSCRRNSSAHIIRGTVYGARVLGRPQLSGLDQR
jgi:hypothetical protein